MICCQGKDAVFPCACVVIKKKKNECNKTGHSKANAVNRLMPVQTVNYKTGAKLNGYSSENFDQNILHLFIVLK